MKLSVLLNDNQENFIHAGIPNSWKYLQLEILV